MSSGDLVPLLAGVQRAGANSGRGMNFRQAVIVTWNPATAENTVLVGDELFSDLPILNTSEAAILAEGDVVGVLTMGSTWGILGRFTIPGSPEAVSALSSLRTASQDVITSVSRGNGTTFADLSGSFGPEVEIEVGASGRVQVTLTANVGGDTAGGPLSTAEAGGMMGFVMSGANSLAADAARSLRSSITWVVGAPAQTAYMSTALQVSRTLLLTGLTPGLTTFTAKYASTSSASNATFATRNITVIAI